MLKESESNPVDEEKSKFVDERESKFVKNFLAVLSLNDCKVIDTRSNNVNKIMKLLKLEMIECGIIGTNDPLIYLFIKDNNGIYHHLQRIIGGLDSSIVTYDKIGKKLNITLDEVPAYAILGTGDFPLEDMSNLAQKMMPVLSASSNVKVR